MTTLFLGDRDTATDSEVEQVIRGQLVADDDPTMAGKLRSAVWYCPRSMTANQFVAAAQRCGIKSGTARNRYHEAVKQRAELDAL